MRRPAPIFLFTAGLCLWPLGCGDDEEVKPVEPAEPQQVVEAPEPEPEEPELGKFELALQLGDQGRHEEALGALEPLLAERPEDGQLWIALERSAIAAGKAGELLDRLSVTEAIGGQEAWHHALRATLALAAERPMDAIDAANALRGVDAGASAAFRIQAARLGATLPLKEMEADKPEDALVLAALGTREIQRQEALDTSAALQGWRAGFERARVALELDDRERALKELDAVAAAEDSRAKLCAARLRLENTEEDSEVASIATRAAAAAAEAQDGTSAAGFLKIAVDAELRQGRILEALELARSFLAKRGEDEQGPVLAALAVQVAEAALAAGEAEEALGLATRAMAGEGLDELLLDGARSRARAAWLLCDVEALDEAAAALPQDQAGVVVGLKAQCEGDAAKARQALLPAGLPAAFAFDVSLARGLAWIEQPQAVAAAQRALELAEELGRPVARLQAGLALERHARLASDPQHAEAALQLLAEGAPSPALQMELFARRLAQGGTALQAPPAAADEPDLLASWRGFGPGGALTGGDAGEGDASGIAAWAQARAALQAGNTARARVALRRAMGSLPSARQGRWAPLLALDGGDGLSVEPDMAQVADMVGRGGEEVAIALHEWAHYLDYRRLLAFHGGEFLQALEDEPARAFRAAHAAESAHSLLWLAGSGPFPAEQREALAKSYPTDPCHQGMQAPPTIDDIRLRYGNTAIFSIRLGYDKGEVLLITPTTARRFPIPVASKLRKDAEAYLTALGRGKAFTGKASNPRPGDRFRKAVLDPGVSDLVGIARYLVVADPELLRLPWYALPEQVEGRRYLADIRTVSAGFYLGGITPDKDAPVAGFQPDFYGVSREVLPDYDEMDAEAIADADEVTQTMIAAGLKNPGELASISRLFGGGFSVISRDSKATGEAFRTNSAHARYVHLVGLETAPGAGLPWVDGHSLQPAIGCTPLDAQLVVISTSPDPELQMLRAQAFMDAGAKNVLVAVWNPPQAVRSRYLTAVYDALNRDRAPGRALAEARESLLNDMSRGGDQTDPSYWGAYLLFGAP